MKRVQLRLPHLAFAAACMLAAAPAAYAQKVGHYQGTNSDGDGVDVYVASVGGALVISGLDDSGTVTCGGLSEGYGVGFSGFNTPIDGKSTTFDYISSNVYFDGTFKFKGDTVSGDMIFAVPLFTSSKEPPKKAGACITAKQTYTATFVGTDAMPPNKGRKALAWPIVTK